MTHLTLRLLGPFQATLNGEPVTGFVSDKVRALLAFLAVEAEAAHRRQALVGLLWPNQPERAARASLRNALANLRRIICDRDAEPPYLLIAHETIQFNRASDHWLDVSEFKGHLARHPADPPGSHQLEEAIALYRGAFLEGFSLRDSPAFEDWSLLMRERLRREVLHALYCLAGNYQARGHYERACQMARRGLELEPWHEEAHQQLMRLLALSGQRGAALAQYRICFRVLREELGVEPTPETTQLFEDIRQGAQWTRAESRPRRHNLPAPLTPLVGRERELAEIKGFLAAPGCRLLTLVGPGGCGKTRLAIEAAANILSAENSGSFSHGVWFISLAPVMAEESIVPTIAQTLGFPFYSPIGGRESDPRQQLLDYLQEKNVLLILDSFEHLLAPPSIVPDEGEGDAVGLVMDILRSASDVKTLVTSRVRLNARDEQLCVISGLEVPGRETREDLLDYSAVRLFVQSAGRTRPGFEPTAEDLTQVVDICRLVGGMPLAIQLAAAWSELLSPTEIAARIAGDTGQAIDFLVTDWRDVPQRQRSMRDVFDHSWNLLPGQEKEVLAGLSVFRGGFTRDAAQHATGATLHELKVLVNRSLLLRAPTSSPTSPDALEKEREMGSRYEIHELLRQYAAEKLEDDPKACKAVSDRHAAYYAKAIQRWNAELTGPHQGLALAEMASEIDNARAAWDWAAAGGQAALLERALDGMCRFYEWRGRYREGETACRTALAAVKVAKSSEELRTAVRILAWQSVFARTLGETEGANYLLQQGLNLLQRQASAGEDIRAEKAFILQQLGEMMRHSDREEARRLLEESLSLHRTLSDDWETANVLECLGTVHEDLADYDRAKEMLSESLNIRRSLGDTLGTGHALFGLSAVLDRQGHCEEAERLIRESIAICQELDDRAGLADSLTELATSLLYRGSFGEAASLLENAAAIYKELGMRYWYALTLKIFAWNQTNLGLYEIAHDLLLTVYPIFEETGDRQGMALSRLGLGNIALLAQDYAKAYALYSESATIFRDIGQRDEMAVALSWQANAALGLGRPHRARSHLLEVLHVATEIGAQSPAITAVGHMAALLASDGEGKCAIELYALASRYPVVGNSRFWEDIVGNTIAATAADLPPEVVAEAQDRGSARDLNATVVELLKQLKARQDEV
jgi:predicted ATPase/DNA-binding SARP family transcriptional activator